MNRNDLKWVRNTAELRDYQKGQWANLAGDVGIYIGQVEVGLPTMYPPRKCPVLLNIRNGRAEENTLYPTKDGELKVLQGRMDGSDLPFGSVTITRVSDRHRKLAEIAGELAA